MKIKGLYLDYIKARDAANASEDAYAQEPENESLEQAFDEAYTKESHALYALIDEVVSLTSGAINRKTARQMIVSREDDFRAIMARIA